jgi:hypothetical protein
MKSRIILAGLFALSFISILLYQTNNTVDYSKQNINKKEVIRITTYYLDSVKRYNQSNLEELLYFEPQNVTWKEPIFRAMQEDSLLSYEIIEVIKINQNLYEVVFHHDNKENKDGIAHNYVAYIDGKWKYVINRRDVPPNIYVFDRYDEAM